MATKTDAKLADRVKAAAEERKELLSEIDAEIKGLEDRLKVLRAQRIELGMEFRTVEIIRERYPYLYPLATSGYITTSGSSNVTYTQANSTLSNLCQSSESVAPSMPLANASVYN
jgi:hypothetical protein